MNETEQLPDAVRNALIRAHLKAAERRFAETPVEPTGFAELEEA